MNLLPELKSAVVDGRVGKVKQFLKDGVSPDVLDERRRTALHWAAERGQSKVVTVLIEAGAQVDLQDKTGATALHLASMYGYKDVVRRLLQSEANTSLKTKFSLTALHLATRNGQLEVVELLSRQTDCDQQLVDGNTPTHLAAQLGDRQLLLSLLKYANPNVQNALGQTPLHSAAQQGKRVAIELLIGAGLDPGSLADGATSPLHTAAMMGRELATESLLENCCSLSEPNMWGLSPAAIAGRFGHHEILRLLLTRARSARELGIPDEKTNARLQRLYDELHKNSESDVRTPPAIHEQPEERVQVEINMEQPLIGQEPIEEPGDTELSNRLHRALSNSGFVLGRVRLQSACSDALQSILIKRLNSEEFKDYKIYIVGSYSEGWSNSLVRLDGQTDADSDIDVCFIGSGMLFHLDGSCKCINCSFQGERHKKVNYEDGHISVTGAPSNPSQTWSGSDIRPAVDIVWAFRCCRYPRIEVLEPGYKTQIAPAVLESLRQEMIASPCHAVAAAPPGKDGQKLRVSTTFLERRLLRSLTTEQGQVFVLLKYIIKKVIAPLTNGLKTYIAKTLMFYLLDKTPADQWQTSELISLTREALDMLLNNLRATQDRKKCMKHFFMRDAWVYLSRTSNSKDTIIHVVKDVISKLPEVVASFEQSLQPLDKDENFSFHPFLVLPLFNSRPVPLSSNLQFHDVYDAIRSILQTLSVQNCPKEEIEAALKLARRIPDFARFPKYCLMELIYMKADNWRTASWALNCCRYRNVSLGLPSLSELAATDAEAELAVWEHMETVNSIWKLLIQTDEPLVLKFLPPRLRDCFLVCSGQPDWYYLNFEAMLRALSCWMHRNKSFDLWLEEILTRSNLDVQELLVAFEFCEDSDFRLGLIHEQKRVVCEHNQTRKKAESLMRSWPSLAQKSFKMTEKTLTARENRGTRSSAKAKRTASGCLARIFKFFCTLPLLIFCLKQARIFGLDVGIELLPAAVQKHAERRFRGKYWVSYSFAIWMSFLNFVLSGLFSNAMVVQIYDYIYRNFGPNSLNTVEYILLLILLSIIPTLIVSLIIYFKARRNATKLGYENATSNS